MTAGGESDKERMRERERDVRMTQLALVGNLHNSVFVKFKYFKCLGNLIHDENPVKCGDLLRSSDSSRGGRHDASIHPCTPATDNLRISGKFSSRVCSSTRQDVSDCSCSSQPLLVSHHPSRQLLDQSAQKLRTWHAAHRCKTWRRLSKVCARTPPCCRSEEPVHRAMA